MQTDKALQEVYDAQYSDRSTEWRELCGRYKAENILSLIKGQSFPSLLECGAGEGSILKFLDASGQFDKLYALEISDSGIEQIQKRKIDRLVDVRKFDGYSIPYPEKFFDLACCSHVLEHVEHPRLLLRELKRVSAFQVFEVPLDYSVGVDRNVRNFLAYGHINVFTPSTFKFLLKSEGFEIISEKYSRATSDVLRFTWQNQSKPFLGELRLALRPLLNRLRKLQMGADRYNEFACNAYTCLARGTGELKIF